MGCSLLWESAIFAQMREFFQQFPVKYNTYQEKNKNLKFYPLGAQNPSDFFAINNYLLSWSIFNTLYSTLS